MLDWFVLALLPEIETPPLRPNSRGAEQVIASVEPAFVPYQRSDRLEPVLLNEPGMAVWAQDLASGKVLLSQNGDRPQPMASITKIMTYLVIREDHDLNDVVTVSAEATKVAGVKIGLYAGEQLTVQTMLEAILIPSANDAAAALAIWDAGSEEAFVEKMNQKARELGLRSAQFYNSSGLDVWERGVDCTNVNSDCTASAPQLYGNKISARDAARMAQFALKDNFFRSTVRKGLFTGTSIDGRFTHEKFSTNQLYGSFINTRGVKTGYTPLAKQCFINLSLVDGHEVLTVVLGSSDRFGETKRLVDWIGGAYEWE